MQQVTYHDTLTDGLEIKAVDFFEGWPRRPDDDQFIEVLRRSHAVALAVTDRRLVGFITAISDGVLTAFIPWLEVLPPYRSQGIGSTLVRRMLSRLDDMGMYSVDLTCDPHLIPYYEHLGLKPINGMYRRSPTNLRFP